jgi:hypothetical protein
MRLRNTILTTAALMAVLAVPASAQTYQDLRSPDAKDAAEQRGLDESDGGSFTLNRDYGSPDAADAARDLPSATVAAGVGAMPGPFTDAERKLVESPEVQAMVDRVSAEIRQAPPVVVAGTGFTDAERKLVESPEVQAMMDRVSAEIRATPQVVEVRGPSGGFDWGDAAIGAAGMLALFSIAAGSALMITGRRRRGVRVATH